MINCPIPWPENNLGAIVSEKDGQLDPLLQSWPGDSLISPYPLF